MQCLHESNRYEPMMDLAVEIQGNVKSLEDALGQFTSTELLDGVNKYECDHCNSFVNAHKRLTVYEAPNILTVALKRFQVIQFSICIFTSFLFSQFTICSFACTHFSFFLP
jgi:ubiquitin carboxyl-terminal hydrolase 36/42